MVTSTSRRHRRLLNSAIPYVIVMAIMLLLVSNCGEKATEHAGNDAEVIGCSTVRYNGEVFDVPNRCSSSVLTFTAQSVKSRSGNHTATIYCSCQYQVNCIGSARIMSYK